MLVADIMTPAAVTYATSATLREAAQLMWAAQAGCLVVVEAAPGQEGSGVQITGLLTERDVLRAVARGMDTARVTVHELMTRGAPTITPDADLASASALMAREWLAALPVVTADGRLVGVLSQRDIVAVFPVLAELLDGRGAGTPSEPVGLA